LQRDHVTLVDDLTLKGSTLSAHPRQLCGKSGMGIVGAL
jgi:adenine/guanine phosphoribosyltransferase-like PRPP-binding protein